ncbi:hypothetical protein AHF37_09874 [Paragonimus kellicotti]|nr:hypothetical protein AHF37_09874 [Paragonimus kellicotti]
MLAVQFLKQFGKRSLIVLLILCGLLSIGRNLFKRNSFESVDSNFTYPDLTFESIDDQKETFAVSSYTEQNLREIRILVLKKETANPLVYCYYVSNIAKTKGQIISNTMETFGVRGRKFGFHSLTEPTGTYRGYFIFCKLPPDLITEAVRGHVAVALHLGTATWKVPIILPVLPGTPKTLPESEGTPKIGLCVAPSDDMKAITAIGLLEFIEAQRIMGVNLILFYLPEQPSRQVQNVFDSYLESTGLETDQPFQAEVVNWKLPLLNSSLQTWEGAQILGYNDCIFRISRRVDYIFHANVKEIFVPKINTQSKKNPGWSGIIQTIQKGKYAKKTVSCFPARFVEPFPKVGSMFERKRVTAKTYIARKKCLLRSDTAHEVSLHWPVKPQAFNYLPDEGTVYNYGTCAESDYEPCKMDNQLVVNVDLQPYLIAIHSGVNARLDLLSNEM